jgi:hypothetical protein
MVIHITILAIKAVPIMPPTTPPATSATFEPPVEDEFDEDDDGDEVGTMGTLPVTSGESVTRPSMRMKLRFVGKATHRQQRLPAIYSNYHRTAVDDEMGSTRDNEQNGATVGSRYAHRGTRVPFGIDPGKLGDEVEFRRRWR